MNKSDVALSESTLVILESATAVLEFITEGSFKKFLCATIKPCNPSYVGTMLAKVDGLVRLSCGGIFNLNVILMVVKSEAGWKLTQESVMAIGGGYRIQLKVNDKGGFDYLTSFDEGYHRELKANLHFAD